MGLGCRAGCHEQGPYNHCRQGGGQCSIFCGLTVWGHFHLKLPATSPECVQESVSRRGRRSELPALRLGY